MRQNGANLVLWLVNFLKFSEICAKMAQISAKNFDFWYMDGSLFLQNGYMDGWHFKNPSGTPLPRPKLSTPPGNFTINSSLIVTTHWYKHTVRYPVLFKKKQELIAECMVTWIPNAERVCDCVNSITKLQSKGAYFMNISYIYWTRMLPSNFCS